MSAERLLAHFERISEAPDAIARLRRFILDLAVRGKLVEQDPEDEPAEEQLERITLAKLSLGRKERAFRKKKSDASIDSYQYNLPARWVTVTLADLVTILNGRAYKQSELLDSGTPVLRVGNLFTSNKWYYSNLELEDDKYCDDGDLIFAWSASFGPFIWKGGRVIYHYHIWKLPLHSPGDLSRDYLHLYLLHKTAEIKSAGHGISMIHMTKEKMELLEVPLPPLAEQHRIVAKVDELMALCDQLEAARQQRDQVRDRLMAATLQRLNQPAADPASFRKDASFALQVLPSLTTTPAQIKQLRQTILNLAVRGKLVEQDPEDEPAEELLQRLKPAKALAYELEGLRSRQPLSAANQDDLLIKIPAGWGIPCFDDVFVIVSGVTKGQRINPSELVDVPYLRVANVQRGSLDLSQVKTIGVRKADVERYRLKDQDILMTEGGDWDKLGRAAIWADQIPRCIHQNHLFRLRVPTDDLMPDWVVLYANSAPGRKFFEDCSKQTTNLASINMTQLRSCPLPLPPLAEQHRIVAKVDELMALCDQLERQLSQADQQRRRLLEAVLAEALQSSKPALGSESRV